MPKLEKLWEKNRREMNDKLYDIIITKVMLVFFLPSVLRFQSVQSGSTPKRPIELTHGLGKSLHL